MTLRIELPKKRREKLEQRTTRRKLKREQSGKPATPRLNPDKPWPQNGEEVFILHGKGHVTPKEYKRVFGLYLKQGNLFRTAEEGEAKCASNAILEELRNCPGARRFIPGGTNWMISVDLLTKEVGVVNEHRAPIGMGSVAFDTESNVKAAIAKVTEARILFVQTWLARVDMEMRRRQDRRTKEVPTSQDRRHLNRRVQQVRAQQDMRRQNRRVHQVRVQQDLRRQERRIA